MKRDNLRAVRLRVGRNVKRLRHLRGLSQEQLAELVGNTNKHIGQVERAEVNVSIDILTAIAAGLSVEVADLFDTRSSRPGVYMITDRELQHIGPALQALHRVKSARTRARRSRR